MSEYVSIMSFLIYVYMWESVVCVVLSRVIALVVCIARLP